MMKDAIMKQYAQNLDILRQGATQDVGNVFIRHGIFQLFSQQFELAKQLLQACLIADGQPMAAAGTTREILMDAYETYLFIDEDLWLSMYADRQKMRRLTVDDGLVGRILQTYVPAFEQVLKELQK